MYDTARFYYALRCAVAGSDGWIRKDTLNACTELLLVLSPTCCESGVVCEYVQLWLSSTALAAL